MRWRDQIWRSKAKGRGPFRKSRPLLSDFSKAWSGFQTTAAVTPEIAWYLRAEPAFPNQFRCSVRCKSFLVPPVDTQFPECLREIRFRFPCGSRLRLPCGLRSILLRVSFPILIQSSFPGPLAGSASGSPGVPFPGSLARAASGSPMTLVYSLLLEDRSSVDS